MQPRFTVGILVLQAEGLVRAIRYLGFLFQTPPVGIVAEPQQITVLVSHFSRDADLVAVEGVGLLASFAVFFGPVMDLCQGFVRSAHTLRWDWKFCAGYGLLTIKKVNYSTVSAASFNQIWIDSIGFNFFARIVFV